MHTTISLILSNSKNSLAIQFLERSGGLCDSDDETNRRRIPCCIPHSLRGEANYMFRNEYNVWSCSCTLCSHLRRKFARVIPCPTAYDIYLYFQFYSLSLLQATRAVSGPSAAPTIAFGAEGAGAFIRHFGPESMGGAADIANFDAEIFPSRTGLSTDKICTKVYLVPFLGGPKWSCI